MGEAKQKEKVVREAVQKLTLGALDDGNIAMTGFAAFMKVSGLIDEPFEEQEKAFNAYMAGADHIFTTMLSLPDENDDVSDKDLSRMESLFKEMTAMRSILEIKFASRGMNGNA